MRLLELTSVPISASQLNYNFHTNRNCVTLHIPSSGLLPRNLCKESAWDGCSNKLSIRNIPKTYNTQSRIIVELACGALGFGGFEIRQLMRCASRTPSSSVNVDVFIHSLLLALATVHTTEPRLLQTFPDIWYLQGDFTGRVKME